MLDWYSPIVSVEVYDPATDTWTKKADMPTVRYGISASVINGKIYIIWGATVNWNPIYSTVEEDTPENWSYTVSPQGKLPTTWGKKKQN